MPAQGKRTKRKFNMRSLTYAVSGPEPSYPVYVFSNRKRKLEKPKHNPFPAP